jgi:hypothetical protein
MSSPRFTKVLSQYVTRIVSPLEYFSERDKDNGNDGDDYDGDDYDGDDYDGDDYDGDDYFAGANQFDALDRVCGDTAMATAFCT